MFKEAIPFFLTGLFVGFLVWCAIMLAEYLSYKQIEEKKHRND